MDMQFGFDFDVDFSRTFAEHAPGTWLTPRYPVGHFKAVMENADAAVSRIAGPARPLFRLALDAARKTVAKWEGEAFRVGNEYTFSENVDVPDEQIELFIAHCTGMQSIYFESIQYKVRKGLDTMAGMYLDGVGTLIANKWRSGGMRLTFYAHRDELFLDSYMDDRPVYHHPYRFWHASYAAQKLAESGKKMATVKPFLFQGRQYIVTGGSSHKGKAVYCGWRLCALADWKGPTYSYATQGDAVNQGRLQRSDHRGVIVLVRGVKYVIESGAVFYDDNVDFVKEYQEAEARGEYNEKD